MMEAFYKDNHNTIYCLDFRQNELPDECVQCVVTSPPYWGLRKYSGEQELIWGGNKDCEHEWVSKEHKDTRGVEGSNLTGRIPYKEGEARINYTDGFCSLCGAWKGAYGLEPTPEMYIGHTIEILREIKRVLRKDGVVFWNIGDSYSATRWSNTPSTSFNPPAADIVLEKQTNLPPKNLCLIPFRVAISAQADGWWVRSVIIWSKPNPMPESVTDRPTESHEYILMLTRSARYYWDADAVRERLETNEKRDSRIIYDGKSESTSTFLPPNPAGRNIRSVWEFPTQPYPEAHFAVFPEKLPEICIKAATPEVGCCSKCGAPWERIIKENITKVRNPESGLLARNKSELGNDSLRDGFKEKSYETLGWQPTCKCNADKVPSIVLDPFLGAGTTLWVAKKLNRRAVGYEISEEYCQLAVDRCRQQVLI